MSEIRDSGEHLWAGQHPQLAGLRRKRQKCKVNNISSSFTPRHSCPPGSVEGGLRVSWGRSERKGRRWEQGRNEKNVGNWKKIKLSKDIPTKLREIRLLARSRVYCKRRSRYHTPFAFTEENGLLFEVKIKKKNIILSHTLYKRE